MLRRIGWWALGGLAVALAWTLLMLILPRGQGPSADWPVVFISMPFVQLFRHVPITWYQAALLNAASYALIGLLFEVTRLAVRSSYARFRHS